LLFNIPYGRHIAGDILAPFVQVDLLCVFPCFVAREETHVNSAASSNVPRVLECGALSLSEMHEFSVCISECSAVQEPLGAPRVGLPGDPLTGDVPRGHPAVSGHGIQCGHEQQAESRPSGPDHRHQLCGDER